jgi:hypothetical protein
MGEKELSLALQRLISRDPLLAPDPRQLVQELIRRDQLRTRWLAAVSLFFWLVAVAGLLLLVVALDRFVIFIRIVDVPTAPAGRAAAPAVLSWGEQKLHGTSLLHHSIPLIGGSVLALLLAALTTVLLVFSSRRATLHQIHLSLLAISEQLRQQSAASTGVTGGP